MAVFDPWVHLDEDMKGNISENVVLKKDWSLIRVVLNQRCHCIHGITNVSSLWLSHILHKYSTLKQKQKQQQTSLYPLCPGEKGETQWNKPLAMIYNRTRPTAPVYRDTTEQAVSHDLKQNEA